MIHRSISIRGGLDAGILCRNWGISWGSSTATNLLGYDWVSHHHGSSALVCDCVCRASARHLKAGSDPGL